MWLRDTFRHTAYRLETLQAYQEPTEAVALVAWSVGQEPQPHPGKQQWLSLYDS
jgi:hypothetical protein